MCDSPTSALQQDFQRLIDQAFKSPTESSRNESLLISRTHETPGLSPVCLYPTSSPQKFLDLSTPSNRRKSEQSKKSSTVNSIVEHSARYEGFSHSGLTTSHSSEEYHSEESITSTRLYQKSDTSKNDQFYSENVASNDLLPQKRDIDENLSPVNGLFEGKSEDDKINRSDTSDQVVLITPSKAPTPNTTPPQSVKMWKNPFMHRKVLADTSNGQILSPELSRIASSQKNNLSNNPSPLSVVVSAIAPNSGSKMAEIDQFRDKTSQDNTKSKNTNTNGANFIDDFENMNEKAVDYQKETVTTNVTDEKSKADPRDELKFTDTLHEKPCHLKQKLLSKKSGTIDHTVERIQQYDVEIETIVSTPSDGSMNSSNAKVAIPSQADSTLTVNPHVKFYQNDCGHQRKRRSNPPSWKRKTCLQDNITAGRILKSASKNCAGNNSPRTRKNAEKKREQQKQRSMRYSTFAEKLRAFREAELAQERCHYKYFRPSIRATKPNMRLQQLPPVTEYTQIQNSTSISPTNAFGSNSGLYSTIHDISELLDVDEILAQTTVLSTCEGSECSSTNMSMLRTKGVFDEIDRKYNSANVLATTLIEKLRMRATNNSNSLLSNLRQRLSEAEFQIDTLKKDKLCLQRQLNDACNESRRLREDVAAANQVIVASNNEMDAARQDHAQLVKSLKEEWQVERKQLERQLQLARRMSDAVIHEYNNYGNKINKHIQKSAIADIQNSVIGCGNRSYLSEKEDRLMSEQMKQVEQLTRNLTKLREKADKENYDLRQELEVKSQLITVLQQQLDQARKDKTRAEEDLRAIKKSMVARDAEHQQELEETRKEHNVRESDLASLVSALDEELLATTKHFRSEKALLIQALREKEEQRQQALKDCDTAQETLNRSSRSQNDIASNIEGELNHQHRSTADGSFVASSRQNAQNRQIKKQLEGQGSATCHLNDDFTVAVHDAKGFSKQGTGQCENSQENQRTFFNSENRNISTVSAPCIFQATTASIQDETHPTVFINHKAREGFFKRMGRRLRIKRPNHQQTYKHM